MKPKRPKKIKLRRTEEYYKRLHLAYLFTRSQGRKKMTKVLKFAFGGEDIDPNILTMLTSTIK